MSEEENTAPAAPELNVDDAVADIASALHMSESEESAQDPGTGETEAAAETAAQEPAPPPSPEDEASPAQPVEAPADGPPDTWTKGAKEKWETLDSDLKAEIRKREGDIAKWAAEAGRTVELSKGKAAVAENLERIMEPFAPVYQRFGINPWNHLQNLLNAHHQLVFGTQEQKTAMVRQLAAEAGIDLAGVPAEGAAPENPLMGHVRQLQQEIAQLKGGVTGVTSAIQESRAAELEAGIVAFMQDVKAHPYFMEVAQDIAPLIEAGAARSLQEAYDLAVYRNPVTRGKLVAAEAEATRKAAIEAATKKAAEARKATSANVVSRRAGKGAPPKESIDDTLWSTMRDINSRAH